MTNLVFPVLTGQGFSVHKKPKMSTIVASHVSGREVRAAAYQNPVWQFEMPFNGLDGTANGQYGSLGAQSMQALMGLFLQCGGQFGTFVYYDPTDFTVTSQGFGMGDGTTTSFQLTRTLGGFVEAIVAPVTTTTTLYFPGFSISAFAPVIKDNGSVVSSANYSISNGLVTFATAPTSGAALTWTGMFGFLCRFEDDSVDFDQFMSNLWQVESLKFRSVRGS